MRKVQNSLFCRSTYYYVVNRILCYNIAFRTSSRKPRPLSENFPMNRFSLDMPSQPALPETPRWVWSGRALNGSMVECCRLLLATVTTNS